ncbi:hypothetical protein [Ruminococcus albus]|uniref:Uncharacterized protein n=1 Tax=Ruminococcus albus TaxID=1264 RepID=A0A1I1IBC7_RUMAL|nr:hypothetical protein [Ruminococcus albus]SFC30590.1 hypothetical protein SAMN02910406_01492 [Ruminococcus albus]
MKRTFKITGLLLFTLMMPVIIVTAMIAGDTRTDISETDSITADTDITNNTEHPLISLSGFGTSLQASVSRSRLTITTHIPEE